MVVQTGSAEGGRAHVHAGHPRLPLTPGSRAGVSSSCLLHNPQGTPQSLLSLSRWHCLSVHYSLMSVAENVGWGVAGG